MAIIWNQPPAPDFSPIETPEKMEEWVEASMDDMEAILAEAKEDEDAMTLTEEEAKGLTGGRGFGY